MGRGPVISTCPLWTVFPVHFVVLLPHLCPLMSLFYVNIECEKNCWKSTSFVDHPPSLATPTVRLPSASGKDYNQGPLAPAPAAPPVSTKAFTSMLWANCVLAVISCGSLFFLFPAAPLFSKLSLFLWSGKLIEMSPYQHGSDFFYQHCYGMLSLPEVPP